MYSVRSIALLGSKPTMGCPARPPSVHGVVCSKCTVLYVCHYRYARNNLLILKEINKSRLISHRVEREFESLPYNMVGVGWEKQCRDAGSPQKRPWGLDSCAGN